MSRTIIRWSLAYRVDPAPQYDCGYEEVFDHIQNSDGGCLYGMTERDAEMLVNRLNKLTRGDEFASLVDFDIPQITMDEIPL